MENNTEGNNTEENVEVLYNKKYGGFGTSEKANELYKKYVLEKNPQAEFDPFEFTFISRTDPVWLRVFHELGEEFNGPYCYAKTAVIPKQFRHHYTIDEYDGKESIRLNYQGYIIDQIKQIIKSPVSSDEKISQINGVFSEVERLFSLYR